VKNNKKNNKLMLAVSLGATVLGNWLGAGALAKNINPSPTLSKLQSAKPITCETTATKFYSDGSTEVTEREVRRRIVTKKLRGQDSLAFEYTYSPSGFTKTQTPPKPRYDFVSQKSDGTIVSLAHEYGFETSLQTEENTQLDERTLTFLPGQLALNKTWIGDSATIVDVDQLKSTVTGMGWMDGEPTWIITQAKMDTTPSPSRGIKNMEIVYNLNPRTLSTTWIFSYGNGTSPKTDRQTAKDYKFIYYARCK
jgi:hypothetical protein